MGAAAMIEMVDDRPPRLGFGELVRGTSGMITGSPRWLWPIWLLMSVLYGVAYYLQLTLRLGVATGALGFPNIGFTLAVTELGGILTAVAVRIFLNRRKDWRRLDRGVAIWLALGAAINLGLLLTAAAGASLLPAAAAAYATWSAWLIRLILLPVWLRLKAWPIGRLVGDAAMTPGRSWRRMRGVVWPTFLATLVVGALPFVIGLIFASRFFYRRDLLDLAVSSAALAAFSLATEAVSACVYRLRFAEAASLSEVFD
jgi:hypothetical protein